MKRDKIKKLFRIYYFSTKWNPTDNIILAKNVEEAIFNFYKQAQISNFELCYYTAIKYNSHKK